MTKSSNENFSSIGKVLKELRLAKGLKLKEAAGTAISISHLSNVESDKNEITAQLLFHVLRNMNVSLREFEAYYNEYVYPDVITETDIAHAHLNKNVSQLESYWRTLNEKTEHMISIKKIDIDRLRILGILSSLDTNYRLSKNELTFLEQYLLKLKEWGKYDIDLFGQVLPILDEKVITTLMENMTNPFQTSINLLPNKQAMIETIIHIINFYLEKDALQQAQKLINHLERTMIPEDMLQQRVLFNFYKAVLAFKHGDQNALHTMQHYQFILEDCGSFQTANQLAAKIAILKESKEL